MQGDFIESLDGSAFQSRNACLKFPPVTCRIHESVVRGILDNRVQGIVTGRLWLAGRGSPVRMHLRGNCMSDLAGCELSFEHKNPGNLSPCALAVIQEGVVGELTASRKAKLFSIPPDEVREFYRRRQPIPTTWANQLYLEWFSDRNGRVILESPDFNLHVSEHAWQMTGTEEKLQRQANVSALHEFMCRLVGAR
jgi:hypothetical protein